MRGPQRVVIVGVVSLDTVETPFGQALSILGGSATYAAAAASLYAEVELAAAVGTDFPAEHLDFFASRHNPVFGLQVVPGATFRWTARYDASLSAQTLDVRPGVYETFEPNLDARGQFIFIGNMDPDRQRRVVAALKEPRLTLLDTMDIWIRSKKEAVIQAAMAVDMVIVNESEAHLLSGESDLAEAAQSILDLGPKAVIVKRGKEGASLFSAWGELRAPAYPVVQAMDPTGAGDSFAGGFLGYLAQRGEGEATAEVLSEAMAHGCAVASFAVEDFGLGAFQTITREAVLERCRHLLPLTLSESRG